MSSARLVAAGARGLAPVGTACPRVPRQRTCALPVLKLRILRRSSSGRVILCLCNEVNRRERRPAVRASAGHTTQGKVTPKPWSSASRRAPCFSLRHGHRRHQWRGESLQRGVEPAWRAAHRQTRVVKKLLVGSGTTRKRNGRPDGVPRTTPLRRDPASAAAAWRWRRAWPARGAQGERRGQGACACALGEARRVPQAAQRRRTPR